MSNLLVLVGGYGFVGRNIIEAVRKNDVFSSFAPAVIDDLSNACPGHETLNIVDYIGSYQDPGAGEFLSQFGDAQRTFVLLAGETRVAESKDRPLDFIDANIALPSKFVAENVRAGDHFILISTAGALFDGTFEVTVDSPYCPKNFYGATKAAEEMILEKLVEIRGAKFSVVRMTNVYGRYSDKKKSAIHAFTRAALDGDVVTINGDGKQTRDFIFSGDVGFGIATLAHRMREGEKTAKINMLGSGESISLMGVVHAIEEVSSKPLKYNQVKAEALIATEPRDVVASKDDVRVLLGDNITSFQDGIRKTYEYYAALR